MSPLPFYTIGVFIGPISREFGWEPSTVLLALTVYTLAAFFMAPFIGALTDRIGARRVVLISIIMFGIAMMLQSLHTGSLALYLLLWSFIAIFGAGTLPITFTKALNNWFDIHRGKALGIALVSTGVFGALAKFFAAEITALYGWRAAYVGLGLLPILIALPMALIAFRDIGDTRARDSLLLGFKLPILAVSAAGIGLLGYYVLTFILPAVAADGWKLQYLVGVFFLAVIPLPLLMLLFGRVDWDPPARARARGGAAKTLVQSGLTLPRDLSGLTLPQALSGLTLPRALSGLTLPQALCEWRFWMLAASLVVISVAIGAIIPNLEQILMSKGFSATEAVGLAFLTGLAVLGGRVIGGFLLDRFWAPAVACLFLSSPALALYMLSAPVVSHEMASVAILIIGFGAGVEYDFLAYLVAKYFGMRSYASIYGALYAFFGLGSGFGPLLLSRFAEKEGEWVTVLIYCAVALLGASLPLLALGKYRDFSASAPAPGPLTSPIRR